MIRDITTWGSDALKTEVYSDAAAPSIFFEDEGERDRIFLTWDQMRILRDQLTAVLDAREKKKAVEASAQPPPAPVLVQSNEVHLCAYPSCPNPAEKNAYCCAHHAKDCGHPDCMVRIPYTEKFCEIHKASTSSHICTGEPPF